MCVNSERTYATDEQLKVAIKKVIKMRRDEGNLDSSTWAYLGEMLKGTPTHHKMRIFRLFKETFGEENAATPSDPVHVPVV